MAPDNKQIKPEASLPSLSADLASSDHAVRLRAVIQLQHLGIGNFATLTALERRAARDPRKEVRVAALSTLGSPAYRELARRRSRLPAATRKFVRKEIDQWVSDGVLPVALADVLRGRYPMPSEQPAPQETKRERAPSPTLSQVLLSETSIQIALSLGAFFVVVAAFIVAAVIESARLPVLTLLTAGFFAIGFGLKRRLPAASFILYSIFTVLLVIDAWVLWERSALNADELLWYWAVVAIFMAAVWVISTALYESRLFSILAFAAGTTAALLTSIAAEQNIQTSLLMVQIVSAIGLGVVYGLIRWKGIGFASALFTVVNLQIGIILLFSAVMIPAEEWFFGGIDSSTWALTSATWLLTAALYIASDQMYPLPLFKLLSMLALLPVPQLLAATWSPESELIFTVTWVWGAVLATAGEVLGRANWNDGQPYGPFLIGASAPLFAFGGVAWWIEDSTVGAAFLAGSGLVYLGLMFSRARAWIWLGSLSFAIAAYMSVVFAPGSDLDTGLALLFASLMLFTGWLILERWLSASPAWQLAPQYLGTLLAAMAFVAFLIGGIEGDSRVSAVGIGILAAYAFGLSAVRRTPQTGFAAAGLLAFSLGFVLLSYEVELWVMPFVALSTAYYLIGLGLQAGTGLRDWSNVFRYSGLVLGAVVGISALAEGSDWAAFGVAVVASTFALEAASQRQVDFGYPAILYYLIAYFMVLTGLDVSEPQAYAIGAALLGFVMHYMLVRAGSHDQAFVMGGLAAVVLLGTTYIQMLSTEEFQFLFILLFQSLVVLVYGVVVRARSLILAPIAISILGVVSVAFSVLAGVSSAILIGCTGLLMIILGVLALLYRESLLEAGQRLKESLGGWQD